jgi:hypothetical protein
MTSTGPCYVCPHCRAVSYNHNDIRQSYCGRCHLFASDCPEVEQRPHVVFCVPQPDETTTTPGKVRIISDGTPHGTKVLDADGNPILTGYSAIVRIEIDPIIPTRLVSARIYLSNVELSLVVPEAEVRPLGSSRVVPLKRWDEMGFGELPDPAA